MDNKISESVQKVVSTMAISGMNLSEEFINQLIEVEEGKKSSEELRQEVIQKYANSGAAKITLQSIEEKLGFSLEEYNAKVGVGAEAHEQDNIPNPFDKLSMDELLFLRKHNYFFKVIRRSENMDENRKLHYYMDESAIPYEDGDNPYIRTEADNEFDKKMIEKYHLKD